MTVEVVEVANAQRLWDDLRTSLVNFDKALTAIIESRAWEPLGYMTFAEAWADRMRGIRLGTAAVAAQVVYALIDSGVSREEALLTLGPSSGVGPATFDALARQHENGVPARYATTRGLRIVRQHFREAPAEPHVVHVSLRPDEYAHYKALAERHGRDLAQEAERAVRAHFSRLERRV